MYRNKGRKKVYPVLHNFNAGVGGERRLFYFSAREIFSSRGRGREGGREGSVSNEFYLQGRV